jgi:hypothetical protein
MTALQAIKKLCKRHGIRNIRYRASLLQDLNRGYLKHLRNPTLYLSNSFQYPPTSMTPSHEAFSLKFVVTFHIARIRSYVLPYHGPWNYNLKNRLFFKWLRPKSSSYCSFIHLLSYSFFRCNKNSSDSIQFEFSYAHRKFLKKLLERKEEGIWTLI